MPSVDHPPEEEAELLMVAAERRQRVARRKLRRRLSIAGIVALVVATVSLGVINVNLMRRNATASVASALPAQVEVPPPTVASASPAADPEPPVVETPSAPPKPESTPPSPKKPPVVVTKTAPAPPPAPAKPAPIKVPAFVPAKADPELTKPPVVEPTIAKEEPKPIMKLPALYTPPSRQRDVESSQNTDTTGRVAHWMAETYGKRDAQRRAELAMTLYPEGDARTEHWRKVLGHLRETN